MGRSHSENVAHLGKLVSAGDLDQYFDLDEDNIKEVMSALAGESVDDVSDILSRTENIARGGEGIEALFAGAYDNQIEEQGRRFVDNHFRNIEAENIRAFREADLKAIRNQINSIESLPDLSGFITRKEKMLKQLKEAEKKLTIPENLEDYARELLKEKKKEEKEVRKVKIFDSWGFVKRRALVVWGKRGIIAVKFLDEPVKKLKAPKIDYKPTKEEFKKKTPKQILTKKGTPFTLKERMFAQTRKRKSIREVEEDYYRIFGDIRPKSEILKLIGEFR